jgi:hypothetical protein
MINGNSGFRRWYCPSHLSSRTDCNVRIRESLWKDSISKSCLTIELLEHSVNSAGAAAAAHGHVELVGVVLGHCVCRYGFVGGVRGS